MSLTPETFTRSDRVELMTLPLQPIAEPVVAGSLRRALDQREFVLHYQPKIDLRSGRLSGAEALLRWRSPHRGLIAPQSFIPLLEQTGLIVDVGDWVVRQALADRRSWAGQGLQVPTIAVNVSAVQLQQPDFVDSVLDAIAGEPAGGAGLELEITESLLMQDVDDAVRKLRLVRAAGVPIALDDFGAGYSSLARLARLPIDTIKIARELTVQLADSGTAMVVAAIIALAHSMRLTVVAEGVDSTEQLGILRQLGCDEVQGFLYSKPLAPEAFTQLIRSGASLP